jgi:hypothetical protein
MSSTFIISKGWHPAWMPRSAIFSYLTQALYEELRESDKDLAQVFRDASNSMMSFLDISSLSADDFNKSITALVSIEKRLLASPEIPMHISTLDTLKVAMYLDERCQQSNLYLSQGIIQLNKNSQWLATGWIFDLVLSLMLSELESQAMREQLERARRSGLLDWSSLDLESLEQAIVCMDKVNLYYGRLTGLHGYFSENLKPAVQQLYALFAEQHQEAMDTWEQKLIQKMLEEEENKTKNG